MSELVSSTLLASRCTKVAAAAPSSGCRELDAPARSSAYVPFVLVVRGDDVAAVRT